jgi:hypothetical protein
VLVLAEPGIEQEGLELHVSTSKGKLVPVVDSTSRRTGDCLVYERCGCGAFPDHSGATITWERQLD